MSKQLDQTIHNLTLHPPKDDEVGETLDEIRAIFPGRSEPRPARSRTVEMTDQERLR